MVAVPTRKRIVVPEPSGGARRGAHLSKIDMSQSDRLSDDGTSRSTPQPQSMVYLLFALLEGHKHGYAVKQRAEELSDGVVRLGPGTLCATIQKAEDGGLISEVPPPDDAVEHAQRRYYPLTPSGRSTLRADVERLGALVDGARAAFGGAGSHDVRRRRDGLSRSCDHRGSDARSTRLASGPVPGAPRGVGGAGRNRLGPSHLDAESARAPNPIVEWRILRLRVRVICSRRQPPWVC